MKWTDPRRVRMAIRKVYRNVRHRGRTTLARLLLRWASSLGGGGKRPYQIVELGGGRREGARDTEERWHAISGVLRTHEARTVLDVGCAEGWFLRQASRDHGCFCVGIDGDYNRVFVGETSRLYDGVQRMCIAQATLTADELEQLPRFDVVLCLSVAHHIMRREGLEAAQRFVTAMATRARKAMIFEMGTSDEKVMHWVNDLPPMPQGQSAFVRSFLESCGLTDVAPIAVTPSLRDQSTRTLFVATPRPGGAITQVPAAKSRGS